MSKKIAWIIGILAIIIIIPAVLFLISKEKTNKNLSASEEIAKFENDKTVTKTYTGTFPCADCSGIEISLSLSQEDINAAGGTFIITQKYLGKENDAVMTKGNWSMQKKKVNDSEMTIITLNPKEPEKIEYFLQTDQTHVEKLDKNGNKIAEGNQILTLLQ